MYVCVLLVVMFYYQYSILCISNSYSETLHLPEEGVWCWYCWGCGWWVTRFQTFITLQVSLVFNL